MVELYINNRLVELNNNPNLGMTYSLFETTNPTAIKNPYSVTIDIPKTNNNDLLFDNIYRVDQQITKFDPSKRVDFVLLNNGVLFERGYMQLTSITDRSYQITLYGVLGDFFYKLKYKEDGSNLTLADIKYTDDDDSFFNFNINKEWVRDSFKGADTDLHHFLKFIPAYNGIPDDFDASSCLVNTKDFTVFPTNIQETEESFAPYNGYGLAKFDNALTEWDVRDLRSYKQRPAIKLSDTITAILDNSGYEYELDKTFFSEKNPYWNKTYITLPLLGAGTESDADKETTYEVTETGLFLTPIPGWQTNTLQLDGKSELDLTAYSDESKINITIPIKLTFEPETTPAYNYLFWSTSGEEIAGDPWPLFKAKGSVLLLQILLRDGSNKIVASSKITAVTSKNRDDFSLTQDEIKNYTPFTGDEWEYFYKSFSKSGNSYTIDGIVLSLNDITKPADKVKVQFVAGWYSSESVFTPMYSSISTEYNSTKGNINLTALSGASVTVKTDYTVSTNTLITKKRLLTTEESAADYLISYAKLFGLYFEIDRDDNKILIKSRNTFFKREVDTPVIDQSKEQTIEPLLFDKKWYLMKLDTPESYFTEKYKNRQNIEYGQQRLDTGYDFNTEVSELYSENVFKQVITAQDSSKYYKSFFKDNKEVPGFVLNNCEWTLFEVRDKSVTNTQTLYGYNYINKISEWGTFAGKDSNYKICCFDKEKSPVDEYNNLVFYNGTFNTPQVYWLTDDVPEMFELNEDRCYLYTQSEKDVNNKQIAYKLTSIPSYSTYIIYNNQVRESLDIGLPKEWFIDGVEYTEDKCIYNRFNKAYYNDLFDKNTRKLTCWGWRNLDLSNDKINLNQFYLIDNSVFVLNKADNFDVSSNQPTQLEFVRVNDITNYTNGQPDYSAGFKLNPTKVAYNIDPFVSQLTAIDSWSVDWVGDYFNPIYTEGDAGIQDFELIADENPEWYSRFCNLIFKSKLYGYTNDIRVEQLPNPDISRKVIVTKNLLDLKNLKIVVIDDSTISEDYLLGTDKQYTIWASRNACEVQLLNKLNRVIQKFKLPAGSDDINIIL